MTLTIQNAQKVKQYMKKLNSIKDESILFFLSSLHDGERKKSEGDIRAIIRQRTLSEDKSATDTSEEESLSLSEPATAANSIEVSTVNGEGYNQEEMSSASSPSLSSASSTPSSFTSLSTIASGEDIDFDSEAQQTADEKHTSSASCAVNLEGPLHGESEKLQPTPTTAPSRIGLGFGLERKRLPSIDNEAPVHQPQSRKGVANTEIYGSLRYSKKHGAAIKCPMDGSTIIRGEVPLTEQRDWQRNLKNNRFGSVLVLQELLAAAVGDQEEATGPRLRLKQLCFADDVPHGSGDHKSPRTKSFDQLPLPRHKDDRFAQQKRQIVRSPRGEKSRTIDDLVGTLLSSKSGSQHRKRGNSWTDKKSPDKQEESNKIEREETEKEKDIEKGRTRTLRLLSPKRGTQSRGSSTYRPSTGTAPTERSSGIASAASCVVDIGGRRSTLAMPAGKHGSTAERSHTEDEEGEEWEQGQVEEKDEWAAYLEQDGKGGDEDGVIVVKSFWDRSRYASPEGQRRHKPVEGTTPTKAGVEENYQPRQRKLTMPPTRVCYTKLDPQAPLTLMPFLLLLSQRHGAIHREDASAAFVYVNNVPS